MNQPAEKNDRLLKAILGRTEVDFAGDHPDEESLALFAAAALPPDEHSKLIEHLADCPACRRVVSLIVFDVSHTADLQPAGRGFWSAPVGLAMALAASLLIAASVGLLLHNRGFDEQTVYQQASQHLERGDFQQARDLLAEARTAGVDSDRLRSLDSEAIRKIPGPVALAFAGRLTDFGYDLSGAVAMAPKPGGEQKLKQAYGQLEHAKSGELDVLLNRGDVLLGLGRPADALSEFKLATSRFPASALAWLGLGLAEFMGNDFVAAERAFRRARQLDPKNIVASINLAMTLEQLDHREGAIETWKSLLSGQLSPTDRGQIEQAIDRVEREP